MLFTQVLNPVAAAPTSWLAKTQAVSAEATRRALAYTAATAPEISVEFVAAVYPEDEPAVPEFVSRTARLDRSLLDLTDAEPRRKLPLIADILRIGHDLGSGDWLIYANSDIAPQPHFYTLLPRLLERHPGGVGICRRNIDKRTIEVVDLPLMYAQGGQRHYGIDTFVFPRASFPSFDLGEVVIALPLIEYAILANMDAASGFRAALFKHLHATFHHGDDRVWNAQDALCRHNAEQVRAVCERLVARHPNFPADGLFDWMQAKCRDVRPKVKCFPHKQLRALYPGKRLPEPFKVLEDPPSTDA